MEINSDRSLILDMALGLSVGIVYYSNSSPLYPPLQLLMYAMITGVGTTLFARFFIRRFFFPYTPPTPEELKHQLDRLESYLKKYPKLERMQRMSLLEQAGALALSLEQWSQTIAHYTELSSLLQQEKSDAPEEQEVLEKRWFHTQLAISFAEFQDHQTERSLAILSRLETEALQHKEPIMLLLVELFQARILSQDDPVRGQSMLNASLEKARKEGYEEDALRLVASEWMELGQPEAAIDLLERAMNMAKERDDNLVEMEVLFQLGFAYGAAKQLPQAAQSLVRLTKNYVLHNYPPPQQIEQLRTNLREQFGKQSFREAYRIAEKKEQQT